MGPRPREELDRSRDESQATGSCYSGYLPVLPSKTPTGLRRAAGEHCPEARLPIQTSPILNIGNPRTPNAASQGTLPE